MERLDSQMKEYDLGLHMAEKLGDEWICQKKEAVPWNWNEFLIQTKRFSDGNKKREVYHK